MLAIELLAAAQAYDLQPTVRESAQRTTVLRREIRAHIPIYTDDRPIADDIDSMRRFMRLGPATGLSKRQVS
ncbi:hypothetical protein OIU34_34065 [Pararhizobium sp. BT-229]|nr:hypothetical protein [Pararhizobium sp. BT-229]